MIKKVLGWVFNRWVLLALLLLLLCVLIHWVGPLVAIGDVRPLDRATTRWVTCAVLVLVTAMVVGWRAWRARRGNEQVVGQLVAQQAPEPTESADMQAVRERFAKALHTLRHARFATGGANARAPARWWQRLNQRLSGRYLYELPWYLIIGAPGSGKTTALCHAGLHFPLAAQLGDPSVRGVGGTRDCDWWFADQAVLIDTAGRFTTQDSDAANDKQTWSGFLQLLRRSRPRQPLNGVLVTVSVPDLLARSAADRQRYAHTVRARLQEIYADLGERMPVYLLVTKSDLMAGFTESFAALTKDERAAPWGFTFALGNTSHDAALLSEFDALLKRLDEGLVDRLQAEADPLRRHRIYGFAHQFASLRPLLAEFVQQVFAPSPYEAHPMLRGLYFVSGTQEGTPIDRVLGAVARRFQLERAVLAPQRASGRSYFLQRLLTDVVFAEQGLAGTRRAWERRRAMLVLAGYGGLALISLGLILAWWHSWSLNARYIEGVQQRAASVRQQVQETPNRADAELVPLLPALDATRSLAQVGENSSAPLGMRLGLYQGNKLNGAAQHTYAQMLHEAMLPRLALAFEGELRANTQSQSQYEALKAYLMMYDVDHFDASALKQYVESGWDAVLGRGVSVEDRQALSEHLDTLLAQGAAVSPQPKDAALIQSSRATLAQTTLAQRVYQRLRTRGLGDAFPAFNPAQAGGAKTPLVFKRASGLPLTQGVPGLFTYKGYHEGFQNVVGDATQQLFDEQGWVLGQTQTDIERIRAGLNTNELVDAVRRLYLTEYRDAWKDLIADLRLIPPDSITQSLDRTRVLSAADNPLVPLLKAMSRETTLLVEPAKSEAVERATRKAEAAVESVKNRVLGRFQQHVPRPNQQPSERIEHIVDDEFAALRQMVATPDGGKAPIDTVVGRLAELQVQLVATDAALKGGSAPQPSPLPTQLRAEAAMAPEPLRSLLDTLASSSARVAQLQLREALSRDVRSQVGEPCDQAITGRYPFTRGATRDVTPGDFTAIFGPGGRFDQAQQRLATYIDTSTHPWSFRAVDGVPLGADSGSLPQFQRAQVIRETFYAGGAGPAMSLSFKPVEMDSAITEFVLDVDGQTVRYNHGPQLIQPVKWPGPRGQNAVRVSVQPPGTGMLADGPWALLRLFDRVGIEPMGAPEKFRATFSIDGRKAVFEVTASSVHNPLNLAELRSFSCPSGL